MLEGILYISYVLLVIIAGLLLRQLWFAMKHFTPPIYTSELGEETDVPSVTICIPARNEMHALTECLEKVIASDYRKLEIIVLDDVSGDDTSALIKSFAHEGVRFVKGKSLPSDWLGKNHALQGLLSEASGSYVLFMDVDTRISPTAVSNMVRYTLSQRASMVSVLPRREDNWRASVLFSPLRYFWEVIFHSKLKPATAGSMWMIKRSVLTGTFHGFKDMKQVIQPESFLSAELAKTNEYRFLIGTKALGVAFEKKWRSQLVTSTRLIFPLLNYQVSLSIMAVLDMLLLLIPAAVLVGAMHIQSTIVLALGVVIFVLYACIYYVYTSRVWNKGALLGAVLWPLLLIQEAILIVASVVQYKRRTVQWKGRKVLLDRQFEAE